MATIAYDEAAHLLRRMGFGGTPEEIESMVGRGRERAVDFLVDYEKIDNSELNTYISILSRFFEPNFSPRRHTDARPGTFGRNVVDGPGVSVWSLSIIKQIRLDESRSLTIRSDIRNLLNHTNFIIQQSNLRADLETFGQVLSSAPGHNIQFSARYSF